MLIPDGFAAKIAEDPTDLLNWDVCADWVLDRQDDQKWSDNVRLLGRVGVTPVAFEWFPATPQYDWDAPISVLDGWKAHPMETGPHTLVAGYGFATFPAGKLWVLPPSLFRQLRYQDPHASQPKKTAVYATRSHAVSHLLRASGGWDGVFNENCTPSEAS